MQPQTLDSKSAGDEPAELIYQGSKFIVKHIVQLDVYVYEQQATPRRQYNRLAVVCYNIDKEVEYPPLYLNGKMVEMYAQQTGNEGNFSREVSVVTNSGRHVDPRKEAIGAFIMSRLGYADPGGVSIEKNSKDTYDTLLVPGPRKLLGISIEHKRRRSLVDEFEKAEQRIVVEQQKLYEATSTATNLANQARISMNTYNAMFHPEAKSLKEMHNPVPPTRSLAENLKRIGSKILHAVASPREKPEKQKRGLLFKRP